MGMIPCLAICTPVERHCFAGGSFSLWLNDWQDCMGVFLGIAVGETPRLLSLWVHLQSQVAWPYIITALHIMYKIIWLPWRHALLADKEAVLHSGTYFCTWTSLGFPSGAEDGGVNNRIAPARSALRLKDLCLLHHHEFWRFWVKTCFIYISFQKRKTNTNI